MKTKPQAHTPGPITVVHTDVGRQDGETRLSCGCASAIFGKAAGLHFCPLHAAAPETAAERDRLLQVNTEVVEALQMANGYLRALEKRTKTPEVSLMLRACIDKMDAALAKAEGRA